jgi:phosphoribosylglycinamide formyltransferase 1
MRPSRTRIAVLASGSGTNLQAILDHFESLGEGRAGDVVVVASDRQAAGALGRAAARGISTASIRTGANPSGRELLPLLQEYSVDLVALAGYLRLVEPAVVGAFEGRILNVHPALLPAFGGRGMYGARVHRAVIEAGARVTGVTVHAIDGEYDRGRILAQWPVPVMPSDSVETLADRVLSVEHVLYPRVVDAVAAGRLAPDGTAAPGPADPRFVLQDASDAELGPAIDRMLQSLAGR